MVWLTTENKNVWRIETIWSTHIVLFFQSLSSEARKSYLKVGFSSILSGIQIIYKMMLTQAYDTTWCYLAVIIRWVSYAAYKSRTINALLQHKEQKYWKPHVQLSFFEIFVKIDDETCRNHIVIIHVRSKELRL